MRFITLLLALLGATLLSAQPYSVTFRLDMRGDTVSPAGIHIPGNYQVDAGFPGNWDPSETPMSDPDGDGIYTATVLLPAGTYFYKFVNDSTWANGTAEQLGGSCSVSDGGGNFNRPLGVSRDTILPLTRYDACNALLNFRVSFQQGAYPQDSVFVIGNFNEVYNGEADWSPTAIRLYDTDADSIYEGQVDVPAGSYQYLYALGDFTADSTVLETLSGACATPDGSSYPKRTHQAVSGVNELPGYCFATCDTCFEVIPPNLDSLYWWNDAVFYEIFVRSFYDSDGDGIGDFNGITAKLDYLNDGDSTTTHDLGVTGIWLMPMNPSPTYHGYDVTDYRDINPDYGTLADFQNFLAEAHKRGIRVIMDYVMNHTSSQHPWFVQSEQGPNNPYRDWYIWEDTNPGFTGPWGQNVWYNSGGDYYYAVFWSEMPDLNYHHPPVRAEMNDIATFWLDTIGLDGFRLDAIRYLGEDGTILAEAPTTFEYLQEFHDHYKSVRPEAITVGEVWTSTQNVLPYVEDRDMIDICFEFDLFYSLMDAINNQNVGSVRGKLEQILTVYPNQQYATFISNHDIDRVYDILGRDEDKMKLAASLFLTLPGVPFLYYGEEVAQTGSGADPNKRKPMQWSNTQAAGFTSGTPWLSPNSTYRDYNVATLRQQPNSLWNVYRKLIQSRNRFAALRRGETTLAATSGIQTFGYLRHLPNEAILTVANLSTIDQQQLNIAVIKSDLQAGTYVATDLLNGSVVGNVTVSGQGGIFWTLDSTVAAQSARIFRLSDTATTVITATEEIASPPATAFDLYPNPAQDQVILVPHDITPGQWQLVGLDGRTLRQGTLQGTPLTLSVADLPAGLYLVSVETNQERWVKKLVVK